MDEKDTKLTEASPSLPSQNEKTEIQQASPPEYTAPKAKTEQLEDARGWESENLIQDLDKQLEQEGYKKGFFDVEFKNPKYFTWMIVAFASMGGLLSGLDQSLISGANLTLPGDLGLTAQQNSLVNSGMPLGGMLHFLCEFYDGLEGILTSTQPLPVLSSSRHATNTLDAVGRSLSLVFYTRSAVLSKQDPSTTA
jgi:hypothetical protein